MHNTEIKIFLVNNQGRLINSSSKQNKKTIVEGGLAALCGKSNYTLHTTQYTVHTLHYTTHTTHYITLRLSFFITTIFMSVFVCRPLGVTFYWIVINTSCQKYSSLNCPNKSFILFCGLLSKKVDFPRPHHKTSWNFQSS